MGELSLALQIAFQFGLNWNALRFFACIFFRLAAFCSPYVHSSSTLLVNSPLPCQLYSSQRRFVCSFNLACTNSSESSKTLEMKPRAFFGKISLFSENCSRFIID